MNILSLFDGISCGRLALERAGIKVDKYFASEIDRYAIQVAKKNFPDTIHIGSVTWVQYKFWRLFYNQESPKENWWSYPVDIDMIIGWSPCQDLSIAKKWGQWLQGEKSSLFFEYVRLLKEVKPKYFLLENVASMKKADKEEITRILTEIYPDVQCYLINSALVSAQNRKRLYWTNIQWVEQPDDKWIVLKDILEENVDEKLICNNITMIPWWEKKNTELKFLWWVRNKDWAKDWKTLSRNFSQWDRVYSPEWKSVSLSANGGGRGAKTGLYEVINPLKWISDYWWHYEQQVYDENGKTRTIKAGWWSWNMPKLLKNSVIRKLTPIEAERLQTLPDNYSEGVSNTQRYKAIWNWWTVDVIAHIFSYIK